MGDYINKPVVLTYLSFSAILNTDCLKSTPGASQPKLCINLLSLTLYALLLANIVLIIVLSCIWKKKHYLETQMGKISHIY